MGRELWEEKRACVTSVARIANVKGMLVSLSVSWDVCKNGRLSAITLCNKKAAVRLQSFPPLYRVVPADRFLRPLCLALWWASFKVSPKVNMQSKETMIIIWGYSNRVYYAEAAYKPTKSKQ